jgi:hypothetical protein
MEPHQNTAESTAGSSTDRLSSRTRPGQLLPGIDGRSAWVRRCSEYIAAHLSDIPDASAAEQSIIRRASVLTVELERMERQFALAGEANSAQLEIYQKTASSMRRLLEAVGLQRRARNVNELSLSDILREEHRD